MENDIQNAERQEQLAFFRDCLYNGTGRNQIFALARQKWPHMLYKTMARRLARATELQQEEKKMSLAEREVLLSAIARGELEVETQDVKYNPSKKEFEPVTRREKANLRTRMAAVVELNRMNGDYDSPQVGEKVIVVEP